jgi:hypothetical protein
VTGRCVDERGWAVRGVLEFRGLALTLTLSQGERGIARGRTELKLRPYIAYAVLGRRVDGQGDS